MTAPISNRPTTHGYTTMRDATLREKVRPAWPDVCVSAKKFALRAHNGSKLAFLRLLGELFAEMPLKGPCWAIFSRQSALRLGLVGDVAHEAGCGGGFAALEAG